MEIEARRAYIRIRLEKAQDDLVTARDLLNMGHYRTSVNRAYYTVFHVASAALLWLDVQREKHSGIHSAFGEFFVKNGIVEPEFGKIYTDARRAREQQDYSLTIEPIKREATEKILGDTERFITRLERYLREQGAIE